MIDFSDLNYSLKGKLLSDRTSLILYSTDASAYKELPTAVVIPKDNEDISVVIGFCKKNRLGIIPRTAGTSLAGQVVGNGIVIDFSKEMCSILEINEEEKWVRVQPGVVLDELNLVLKKFGLFFGPETSTSNRCMIGGMVGNNACGSHSLIYGSTRDHLLEVKGFLSDGSEVHFKSLSEEEFKDKMVGDLMENVLYRDMYKRLSDKKNAIEIENEYPDKRLKRRNTGYAIDQLLQSKPFNNYGESFNFCKLIAGSEGTLFLATEIKLNLIPVPPKQVGLATIHFDTLEEALEGNLIALKYLPGAIELIDDVILKCTLGSIEQRKNRFFIEGEPGAILVVEWARETKEEILLLMQELENELKGTGLGYSYPRIFGDDIKRVWALRKAGLGLLSNVPGDAKPVSVIEDTAVDPSILPAYIADFKKLLQQYNLSCVFHAHAATGELHLRPVLDLKDPKGLILFRTIATEVAYLVKKYHGSLSGEHGDGRLRGEFIPIILGQHNYELIKEIKRLWDPENLFNPGKIVNTPPMDQSLRLTLGKKIADPVTIFDWSDSLGFYRHIEKCNGSGDCRKSHKIGGTMCPSYMATHNEKDTTRARANLLNELLIRTDKKTLADQKEIYSILDLCLSCKGCKSECPSGVDMTKIKAEFLQQYYDIHGSSLRSKLVAQISDINKIGTIAPSIFNFFVKSKIISSIFKKTIGFANKRSIPTLWKTTLYKWCRQHLQLLNSRLTSPKGMVFFFVDEFTNYNDTEIGIKAVQLLNYLGYRVEVIQHEVSGRTYLSKGYLRQARKIAQKNVRLFTPLINDDVLLVGIEPSAILTFRDEYPDLLVGKDKENAIKLAKRSLLLEEFLVREYNKGNIGSEQFTKKSVKIRLHGHCQQKAVASTMPTKQMLSLPENYQVDEVPSGCCGMAGSFGYEKEHYELSMQIGELVLFPELRLLDHNTIVAAPGTSCRHHIFDGTGKRAVHPVEILFDAIRKEI